MSDFWGYIRFKLFQSGSKLGLLITVNVAVFLLINIPVKLGFTGLAEWSDHYLAMPAALPRLIKVPWTIITYMFMHDGFLHILFNMLWLYWFGQLFEEYLGHKRTLTVYFLGGLAGAFFFVASYNIFPMFANSPLLGGTVIVGASAGVTAIIIATATLLPDYEIFLMIIGPVKLKWLALFFIAMDLLGVASTNAGGEIAHLGGALLGFVYIKQLRSGNDWANPINKLFTPRPKMKVAAGGADGKKASGPALPRQDEIDRILDKISQNGYDSLSKQEKETLFRASKNDR